MEVPLYGIGVEIRSMTVGDLGKISDWLDGSCLVIREHDAHKCHVIAHGGIEGAGFDAAMGSRL